MDWFCHCHGHVRMNYHNKYAVECSIRRICRAGDLDELVPVTVRSESSITINTLSNTPRICRPEGWDELILLHVTVRSESCITTIRSRIFGASAGLRILTS